MQSPIDIAGDIAFNPNLQVKLDYHPFRITNFEKVKYTLRVRNLTISKFLHSCQEKTWAEFLFKT